MERVMLRFLLSNFWILAPLSLASCSPSPQKAEMPKPSASSSTTDSPAAAEGRRTLSTAFVRVGPDGQLTVKLRDARVLVLRNVVMNAADYCGELVSVMPTASKFCGNYADVAAAQAGGGPVIGESALAVTQAADPAKAK
jgi:hypothetical protein